MEMFSRGEKIKKPMEDAPPALVLNLLLDCHKMTDERSKTFNPGGFMIRNMKSSDSCGCQLKRA